MTEQKGMIRELWDPNIVPRTQQALAALMIAVAVLNIAEDRWLTGAVLIGFALYILVTQAGRYHVYRAGYFRGARDQMLGGYRDDPHPDDMDRAVL